MCKEELIASIVLEKSSYTPDVFNYVLRTSLGLKSFFYFRVITYYKDKEKKRRGWYIRTAEMMVYGKTLFNYSNVIEGTIKWMLTLSKIA